MFIIICVASITGIVAAKLRGATLRSGPELEIWYTLVQLYLFMLQKYLVRTSVVNLHMVCLVRRYDFVCVFIESSLLSS